MCLRRVIKVALTSAFVAGAAVASTGSASADAPRATWEKIAKCESGGNWQIDTGNGYYGGPQFALATWHEYGGTGMPQDASKDEQIRVAERVLRSQGWAAWPMCSRKLGLR